ncbi:MAG: AAA family ATPase [Lactobacillus sp.]|uniref:ATP-binding protein n=1 Tax=Lactobacillus sp. TaxID=1591 RepID=UPI0023C44CCB|nr:AAA family ATPase [Lactobacillus sp.]
MKLTQIKIIHFGKLNDVTFNLNKDLTVFLGANEAGKSTTVAFVKQILFGFHLRTNKSPFFENYQPLDHVSPMGGSLTFEDKDGTFVLSRLYAKGDTKKGVLTVSLNDQEVPESVFFDRIQNIDGSFYTDSFIFNQDMLREVNGLSQAELMEQIYFLGASQSHKLLDLRDEFSNNAQKLFKKSGRKPVVNQLINQIQDQKEVLAQTDNEFKDYRELEEKVAQERNNLKEVQEELAKLNEQGQKISLLMQKLTNFKQYQELKQELKPISFSKEDYEKAQAIQSKIADLTVDVNNLNKQLQEIETSSDLTNKDKIQALVDHKAEVLHWESESKDLQRQIETTKKDLQSYEQFQPEAVKLGKLSSETREQIKSDYQDLKNQKQEANNLPGIVSLILLVAGLFSAIAINNLFVRFLGIMIALGGMGLFVWTRQKNAKDGQKEQEFIEKYGLDPNTVDLNSLWNELVQIESKKQTLFQLDQEQQSLNEKIQAFVQDLHPFITGNIQTFSDIVSQLNSLQKLLDQNNLAKQHLNDLAVQLQERKNQLAKNKIELSKIFAANKVTDFAEFTDLKKQAEEQDQLKLKIDALQNDLQADLTQLEKIAQDPNALAENKAHLEEQISAKQAQINDLHAENAKLENQMNILANSDKYFAEKQKLADLESSLNENIKEYLANLLTSNWIARGLDLASNERFPKMLEDAKKYFKLLTGGRYIDIELDKKLKVKRADGKKFEVDYLSRGTSEQLYFALKLAFVEQVSDKIALPILIDDAFVNFDAQRTSHIVKLLEELAKKTQVLIFTARQDLVDNLAIEPIKIEKE